MGTGTGISDPPAEALQAYVGAFVDELARAGVTDVCVCPGSRSTPLALMFRRQKAIRVWMHLDERSAGFFALGMAKALRRPVALLSTSGTAAVNFGPAVVEARYGRVPLLVLTADRPPELRGVGATQTIDQLRLYGPHAKWSEELLLPEATPEAIRYVRAIADRAVSTAQSEPAGPVHLNFPFREPLIPSSQGTVDVADAEANGLASPQTSVTRAKRRPIDSEVATLAGRLRETPRGLIVCGPQDDAAFPAAATRLARDLAYPLLADVLSQVRCGPHAGANLIDSFDAFLRDEAILTGLAPEVVIRFGATPVSKPMSQFLERNPQALQIVVDEGEAWTDPQRTTGQFFYADPVAFCEAISDSVRRHRGGHDGTQSSEWLTLWHRLNEVTTTALDTAMDGAGGVSEPAVFRRLARLLPDDSLVYAGNSMPVRDLDTFFPASQRPVRFLANRGASGIDGVVSAALGAAAVSPRPVVLVIGDLSLYYDMNGLLAARRHHLNATIILINNDGGGIFSFLPQAGRADHFEELFGTPHGLDFRHAAQMYGLDYALARSPDEFDSAVRRSIANDGVSLIEVRTDRDENVAVHRNIWAQVSQALGQV